MPGTPGARTGLAQVLTTDAATLYRTTINAIRDWVETYATPSSDGTLAARPTSTPASPGIRGRIYHATDIGLSFRDTGTGWAPIGMPIGGTFGWVAAADLTPEIVLGDGRTVASASYSALDALIGAAAPSPRTHLWNGGASPGSGLFRIPDFRGRVRVGPDDMGTAQGAAGRLPNSSRALGQSGGEERHTQTVNELAQHFHEHTGQTGQTHPNEVGGNGDRFEVGWGGADRAVDGTRTQAQGSSTPFNIMQPYAVENVLVRII